ncbi:MAG: exo-beta-N-acetylmuramidase NamZ domain-containing protein, partial [Cytophagaceae bacterium]
MDKLFWYILGSVGTCILLIFSCSNQSTLDEKHTDTTTQTSAKEPILCGADQLSEYVPLLKNKNVALVVNQTSVIGKTHLVDSLLSLKVGIKKIFSPEHGFRGTADAGEKVGNETDAKTGLPIISLYGKNKKPSAESLAGIDIVIFDIQDVGARFYTYISTMHYVMQACAENNKTLLILDRPNPNGYYVAGPVLDMKCKSFVGMHPIPIVHGLTIAELAGMINGEKWLDSAKVCTLQIVKVKNYSHKDRYSLPVKPSPNLPNDQAIRLYPALCLFEGTNISVGRGTEFPFQVIGSPNKSNGTFKFTPKSIEGMAKNPTYENQLCYGTDLRNLYPESSVFTLKWLLEYYHKASDKEKFFNDFFKNLAGNTVLKEQIKKGMTEDQIKKTWE